MKKNTTTEKIVSTKQTRVIPNTKTEQSAVVKPDKQATGLKKAKDLAKKGLSKVASEVSVDNISVKNPVKKIDVTKVAAKKVTTKKAVKAVVKASKVESPSVAKASAITPQSLSRDPGGISATSAGNVTQTPVFDPLKKPTFIPPVTLSGKPLPLKQFKN